jgi:nucleoredoxin
MSDAFANLLGSTLLAPNGTEVQTRSALANKSVVGLYFSAHWCPPCRMFTPILSEKFRTAYRGKGMEIVFVSSDRDEHSFKEYHQSMPWLALPLSAHQIKQSLSMKFGVSGIPCLVILDGKTAQLITLDGRDQVMSDSTGSKFFGVTVAPSFPGSGQSLGGNQPPVAVDASAGSSSVYVDRSKPVTSIQIRFPDGSRVTQEFNSSARCSEVLSFVSKSIGSTGGKRIKLSAGFPMKEIEDMDSTVMAAGIANSQVTVQLA